MRDCSGKPTARRRRCEDLERKARPFGARPYDFYSNLILYFLMLRPIKKRVMAVRTTVSFQMVARVAPLSRMALTMMINHLAGMILLMICKGKGMLEMGKMKPESMITGNMSPIKEIIMAVCCELETVDIKIPKERAVMMNKIVSKARRNRLP